MRIVRSKQMPEGMTTARMAQALPAHIWFQYCAMAGELLGYATGPGDSPQAAVLAGGRSSAAVGCHRHRRGLAVSSADLVAALRPDAEAARRRDADRRRQRAGRAEPPSDDRTERALDESRRQPSVFAPVCDRPACGTRRDRGHDGGPRASAPRLVPRRSSAPMRLTRRLRPSVARSRTARPAGSIEWASYFTTQGPHMAPLGDRVVRHDDERGQRLVQAPGHRGIRRQRRPGLHGHPAQPSPRRARRGPARRRPHGRRPFRNEPDSARQRRSTSTTAGRFPAFVAIARDGSARTGCAWPPRCCCRPGARCASCASVWPRVGCGDELLASAPLVPVARIRRRAPGSLVGYLLGPGDSPSHLR